MANNELLSALEVFKANGKFEEVFMVEDIEGIDKAYSALNGKGFVFVVGDEFFATDAKGNLLPTISKILKTQNSILNFES